MGKVDFIGERVPALLNGFRLGVVRTYPISVDPASGVARLHWAGRVLGERGRTRTEARGGVRFCWMGTQSHTQLGMAQALIARARASRSSIGDHGDPYEDALIRGDPSLELKVIVKEILDHLRSALDYMAHECCQGLGTKHGSRIYFPIARRGFKEGDFDSLIRRNLPGVVEHKPHVAALVAGFQEFRSVDNGWLPDFVTLCNQGKHVALSVVRQARGEGSAWNEKGVTHVKYSKKDGSPLRSGHLLMIEGFPSLARAEDRGTFTVVYVELSDINRELLTFLDECIDGVARIVEALGAALS